MNTRFANKVLRFVEINSALTKQALDELQIHRAAQKKASDLRATVLSRLMEVGCVSESTKEAAEAMLAGHAETLGLLKSAAEKLAELKAQVQKSASELGRGEEPAKAGAGTEKAAFDSLNDGYVGRKTSQRKASDEAIMRVLQ